ncbi:PIR protein [Plasmodium ovale]|nr:PIR protein [Plasmodium ovale]
MYEEFNQVNSVHGYDTHFEEALQKMKHDSKLKEIYSKLVGNLLNNSKLKKYAPNHREYCMHLHFWLYDQIIKIFKPHSMENKQILDIINAMFNGWHSFIISTPDAVCSAKYSFVYIFEDWDVGKIFHDYFKNFQYITDNYTSSNIKCKEYRKYIQHIEQYYASYKNKCSRDFMAPCNISHRIIDDYNPNVLLSKTSCETESSYRVISERPSDEMSETMGPSGLQGKLDMEPLRDESAPSASVHNIVVAISSSFLGIFVLFIIFYRLTPLGHWLRTRLLSKKIMDHNTYEEEENEFIVNIYDLENRIHDNSGHNMGYNALNRI